ncbi:MAG TPA: M56 family metallopeptidase, partial [Gemmataceae bacterium]|nr:M56 family metallopeptidase [Gemmataceae bacterium]
MFTWLIVHTVVTAAMAVLVAAACRFFRRGPAVRHLLWLIVLLKFLTPPVVSWPWSLPLYASAPRPPSPSSAPEAATAQVRTIIIDEEPATDIAPSLPDAPPAAPAAPPAADPPALASEPAAAPAFSWDWLPTAAVCLWIAGGAVVALRNAGRIYRWRRRLARGLPAPESLTELVRELAETMGVRPPRLVVLAGVASPMVWGFGAPRLIWPLGLEDRLPAEGQRVVLLHELAHL